MDKNVLNKISLKAIVEAHTRLSPAGPGRWKGKSPFSEEKTASLFVDDNKKVWYDWSSGQSGGVLKFLELAEGRTYDEAVDYLHQLAGIPREKKKGEKFSTHERLYAACKAAQEYFRAEKEKALEYNRTRGYPDELVDKFGLGYIGDGFKFLQVMRGAGFTDEVLISASLASINDRGQVYPFFQKRVMFPIKDSHGAVVGFTGRALDDEVKPKYLNSRETPIFKKNEILWGYDEARLMMHKQDRVFVSEGTYDISLQQYAGLPAVGTLSANVSDKQLFTLGRVVHNIYLTFDRDAAGMRAMAKTSLALFEKDVDCIVYMIVLPDDVKDSADFIAKYGVVAYNELIEQAIPDTSNLIRYFYDDALQSSRSVAAAKRKVLEKVKPYILAKSSGTYRQLDLIERIAQILNLSMASLNSWLDINPTFSHNSRVYGKIEEISFPAPIYERRLMTECMKDITKATTVYANLRREDIESSVVLKVLDEIIVTKSDEELIDNIKTVLTKEEFRMVMDAYSQSSTESYDILFLCEVANSNRARLPRERLTNILGRKKRPSEKETRSALRDIARKEIGYKNL